MILKTKIIASAVALTVTAPLAAWAAVGFPGTPLSTAVCSPVGPSQVVNTQMVGDREVSVTWDPRSLLNCGVTGYNIVGIDSQGKPQQVVATAQRDAGGVYVRGLNLCTFYRFGVQAKYSGHVSEVSFPAKPAFVSGPPDRSPPVITVIVTGTSTSGPADSFSPATASFCTSPNGVMPSQNGLPSLRNLADSWLNDTGGKTDKSSRTSGAGNNLIDSMAATGGYVLPYSYTGINMTGTATNPMLTVGAFTGKNVADANPLGACSDPTCHGLGEPPLLQASLASIHKTFPYTPIIVIGHSLGGLIAEQWWLQYSKNNTEGVIQVISLDSPLNGVAAGAACATGFCGPSGNPLYSVVGYDPGIVYAGLWAHQGDRAGSGPYANNQTALALDSSNHLFTAIGDLGDPLYDVGDYPASHFLTGVKNIGLMSQVFWTEPSCVQSGYDLSSAKCTATGQAIINPCGHPMNDGTGPIFDVPSGSMWIHSNVKNCPQLISDALGWYHQYVQAHSTPTLTPTAQCTAFSSACPDSPSPSVLIKLKAGTFNGIEPVEIDFSADGSNSVYGIHWAPWSPDGYALGTGTSHGSCVPASACNFPVKLTLTNPVNGYFLDIKEVSGGDTFYFADAPGHPWPYNATAGTPVSSPSTPASRPGPATSASPWSVVSAYYADVNAGNYRAAWALMSSGWKATQGSYAHWKAGYAGSNDGHVSEVLQQEDYVTVTVTVPGQRTYHGWYQVDGGKITTAYLHH
jgi:hypothetical protein